MPARSRQAGVGALVDADSLRPTQRGNTIKKSPKKSRRSRKETLNEANKPHRQRRAGFHRYCRRSNHPPFRLSRNQSATTVMVISSW